MAFRGMMARLGSGGARVETVLDRPETTPGGAVTGTVHVTGGSVAQEVTEVRVSLQATVEVERGDSYGYRHRTAPKAGHMLCGWSCGPAG